MNFRISKNIVLHGITFLLLAVCVLDYDSIPFWKKWGLDFQNLHAFHNCELSSYPYLIPGVDCNDWLGRPMYYPPLLYWSFFWTSGLSFASAYALWVGCLIGCMLVSFGVLAALETTPNKRRLTTARNALVWLLILCSMPFVFSVERGNTDSFVVFGFCLSLLLYSKGWHFWWGIVSSFVVLFKLYPVIPAGLIFVGFAVMSARARTWSNLWRYLLGVLAVSAASLLFLWSHYIVYVFDVLPGFAEGNTGVGPYSHSVLGFETLVPGSAAIVKILLGISWLIFSIRVFEKDPVVVFVGTLAISTFFAGTSYDYNLVTVYPFLFVLYLRSRSYLEFALLFAGILVFLGDRHIWHGFGFEHARLLSSCLWLIMMPWFISYFGVFTRTQEESACIS